MAVLRCFAFNPDLWEKYVAFVRRYEELGQILRDSVSFTELAIDQLPRRCLAYIRVEPLMSSCSEWIF